MSLRQILYKSLIALVILCFGWATIPNLAAQLDTNSTQIGGGRASPEDEERVRTKINEFRLEMVMRQWWNLPTEKESKRRNKGLYDRYNFNFMPIGGELFMQQAKDNN